MSTGSIFINYAFNKTYIFFLNQTVIADLCLAAWRACALVYILPIALTKIAGVVY